MHTIVVATANPHKVAELRDLLNVPGLAFVALADLPGAPFPEPAETGTTFEANCAIKALAYCQATGFPCLADDSGLEIDALGGRPGVISSHYSTDGRETGLTRDQRDQANNQRVLRELGGVPDARRTARFLCCMALAQPSATGPAIVATSRGAFEGRIGTANVPRGTYGFGYDPLFLVAPDFARTSAELLPHEKNALSHRAAAAAALRPALARLFPL